MLCICDFNSPARSAYAASTSTSSRSRVPRAFGLNSSLHVPSLNNLSLIPRICAARSTLISAKSSSLLGSPVPGFIPHARSISGLKTSSTALPATLDIQTDGDRRAYRLPEVSNSGKTKHGDLFRRQCSLALLAPHLALSLASDLVLLAPCMAPDLALGMARLSSCLAPGLDRHSVSHRPSTGHCYRRPYHLPRILVSE